MKQIRLPSPVVLLILLAPACTESGVSDEVGHGGKADEVSDLCAAEWDAWVRSSYMPQIKCVLEARENPALKITPECNWVERAPRPSCQGGPSEDVWRYAYNAAFNWIVVTNKLAISSFSLGAGTSRPALLESQRPTEAHERVLATLRAIRVKTPHTPDEVRLWLADYITELELAIRSFDATRPMEAGGNDRNRCVVQSRTAAIGQWRAKGYTGEFAANLDANVIDGSANQLCFDENKFAINPIEQQMLDLVAERRPSGELRLEDWWGHYGIFIERVIDTSFSQSPLRDYELAVFQRLVDLRPQVSALQTKEQVSEILFKRHADIIRRVSVEVAPTVFGLLRLGEPVTRYYGDRAYDFWLSAWEEATRWSDVQRDELLRIKPCLKQLDFSVDSVRLYDLEVRHGRMPSAELAKPELCPAS